VSTPWRLLLGCCALAATRTPLRAQTRLSLVGGLGPAAVHVHSRTETGDEALSGTVGGGDGMARLGRLELDISYLEGRLQPDTIGPAARDYVEGRALLGVHALSWLALKIGPHARSYVTGAGTQRWVFWEAHVRADGSLAGSQLRSYVELWRVLSASVNVIEPYDYGQGGEAGLLLRLPRAPVWAGLAYGLDHSKLGGGLRLETHEAVRLTIGIEAR